MTSSMSDVTKSLNVARCIALRLDERLVRQWAVDQSGNNGSGSPTDSSALAVWRGIFGADDPHLLDRRLRWDGLEESRIAELISAPQEPPLPIAPWAVLLENACQACDAPVHELDRAQDASNPLPFEEVLLPFVHVARRRLRRAVPGIDQMLLPPARASSERALLRELAAAADQTLFAEFAATRAANGGPGLRFDEPPRSLYRRFIRTFRGTRLNPLIERYPVLARLLAVRAALWVEAGVEFLHRLKDDRGCLAETLGIDPRNPVAYLKNGLGDSHGGGRAVTSVRFASGMEIVYKPRPLGIDVAFYGLLEWLNARGLNPRQRILRVLDRGAYGWVESVAPRAMAARADVKSYYERAGGLLAVASALGGTDLHNGNVIASGSDPVPVDLETVMGVFGPRLETGPGEGTPPRQTTSNVLATMLLPFWRMGPDGWELREGGIGGGIGDEIRALVRTWRYTNTDWMVQRASLRLTRGSHRARRETEIVRAVDHLEDIVRGFRRGYALLEGHRDAILSGSGPLAAFRGCRVRVLLRDTRVYLASLRKALHPRHLMDGLDHSFQFEILRSSLLRQSEPVTFWPAFGSEQRDLENLDYPLFSMATDRHDLYDAHARKVGTFGSATPLSNATQRVAGLSADDREHQVALIRFSFACLSGPRVPERCCRDEKKPAHTPLLETESCAVGRVIESLALRDPDGPPCWVGQQWIGSGREAELRRLDLTLFDGAIGVALFLVALDTVAATGHADLAVEALLPLRQTLRRDKSGLAALTGRTGIGIAKGLGGIIYALTQIGRMTEDASWLDDARLASHAICPSRIRSDKAIEVFKGASGALLSLLSLHALVGDQAILDRAIECGEHILASMVLSSSEGQLTWVSGRAGREPGFAHGVSGISAALARLARVTGDERYRAASNVGFRHVASTAASGAESESPQTVGSVTMAEVASLWHHTWCNGSVGSELGHIHYGFGPPPMPSTVSATSRAELGMTDHPCCGNLGRAELLLSAGHKDLAVNIAEEVVQRARQAGSYQVGKLPDSRWVPGFFQGLSGIGYQLLRISAPSRLPCVLAFE